MNKYRNIVTGAVFATPCVCAGANWEPVKGKKAKPAPQEKEPETAEEQQDPAPEQATDSAQQQGSGTVIGPAPGEQTSEETGAAESNE